MEGIVRIFAVTVVEDGAKNTGSKTSGAGAGAGAGSGVPLYLSC
jgi:hypothetical protein